MIFFLKGRGLRDLRNGMRFPGALLPTPRCAAKERPVLLWFLILENFTSCFLHTREEKRISVFSITLFLLRTVKYYINITLK